MRAYTKPPNDLKCPLNRAWMHKVCPTCAFWIHVRGKNPQTNEEFDGYNCALAWMPILTIENSQMQRQTGAAIESFRNETIKRAELAQQQRTNGFNQITSNNPTRLLDHKDNTDAD